MSLYSKVLLGVAAYRTLKWKRETTARCLESIAVEPAYYKTTSHLVLPTYSLLLSISEDLTPNYNYLLNNPHTLILFQEHRMADGGSWRHTEDGRPYHVDSGGRYVYVGDRPASPYGGSAPNYDDTVPAVTGQTYQTNNQGSYSWPGTALPSYEHQKLSGHNVPHFGDGSQQSAYPHVDHPATDHDVYRNAKNEWGRAGPPDSEYDQEYYQYKDDAQDVASDAANTYATYKGNATHYPSSVAKDNSDTLGGKPLETQNWHAQAAELADDAAQASQA